MKVFEIFRLCTLNTYNDKKRFTPTPKGDIKTFLKKLFGVLKEKSYRRNYRTWCETGERASVQFFLTKTLLIYIGCPEPHFHPTALKNSRFPF